MKIKVTTKNEVHLVKIEGPIKAGNEFELGEKIEQYIKKGVVPKFIIDLKKVPFINSAGLGIFLNIYKHIDGLNGRMVFANLSSDVENLMEITKLSTVFEIFRNADEAMESFDF
ncbi:MAG TPA: STAS domain-containing protein [Leptospiraceae bacterium]|nr:STAS domain-containing protein [Leptospiraceae bacterium]HMY65518.1 STAS domain-containing protein [Leptospiraceae bacterium]HMZ58040.1 STAS domain-containing protein [Leptospiraceae bacterium]HNF13733.1 STAS domain-containing protein [Leptospiraceae bacterium]HNF23874.1 STAS domain-containing protein [Leptospiraceae bacterium]